MKIGPSRADNSLLELQRGQPGRLARARCSTVVVESTMIVYAKKYSSFFFCERDEMTFGTLLKESIPDIQFIDGSLWENDFPTVRRSIPECREKIIFLWSRTACPTLPFKTLNDGKVRGPTSGVVVQFMRCVQRKSTLLSGDIGIGYERRDKAIAGFVKSVWDVIKSMNVCAIDSVNPRTGETIKSHLTDYFVGAGAKDWSDNGKLLKHCSAEVYYKSEESGNISQ